MSVSPQIPRRHPRVPLELPVTLVAEPHGEHPAELVNISLGGLLLRASRELQRTGRVHVTFAVAPGAACEGKGRVVRSDEGDFGVEFEELNSPMRAFIEDMTALSPELHSEFLAAVMEPRIHISAAPGDDFEIDVG